jgi:diguanylate cyclase (GGDEF)-like protein
MSHPIWDNSGNYLGILSGTIYLQENNFISQIFGNSKVDSLGSYYYIVDASGNVLYHPDKLHIGKDVSSNKAVQRLKAGESGNMQVWNTRGDEQLAGYSHVPVNGWGIVVVSPVSLVRDQLVGHIQNILALSLIPFIVLLLAVVLIARQLAQPFTYLADLVSRMGRKPFKPPVVKPHWSREADLLAKAVFLAAANVQKQTDQLTYEAATDALTGLPNRRSLEDAMSQWIGSNLSFSLIMLDVDRFKLVNDTYGHGTGDEVLKHVAATIACSLRPGDVCYRYGGEEFVILLARTVPAEAYRIAEKVRSAVEESGPPIPSKVTVSEGIAHFPRNASDRETLLDKADSALYRAKSSGRNKTVLAEEAGETPTM